MAVKEKLIMQIKSKVCYSTMFFQDSKTIIQSSKEVALVTYEQMKFQRVFLIFVFIYSLMQMKKPTNIHVRTIFIHQFKPWVLARDTKVQRKSMTALCKTHIHTHQKQKNRLNIPSCLVLFGDRNVLSLFYLHTYSR